MRKLNSGGFLDRRQIRSRLLLQDKALRLDKKKKKKKQGGGGEDDSFKWRGGYLTEPEGYEGLGTGNIAGTLTYSEEDFFWEPSDMDIFTSRRPPQFHRLHKKKQALLKKRLTTSTIYKKFSPSNEKEMSKYFGARAFSVSKDPFEMATNSAMINLLRGVENEIALRTPPKDRYVKLRSGPYRGKWKKVFEQVPLWKEAFYKFVVSSNLLAIAYNPEDKQLEIEFKNGGVYRYKNIPMHIWTGLSNASSHGKYFWKHIRRFFKTYPFKRVRFMRKENFKLPKNLKAKGYIT